jgi:hypothetical protein
MTTYQCTGNKMVNVCSMYQWAMKCDETTFDKDARNEAARLWILVDLFPQIPAADLKRLSSKRWTDLAKITLDRDSDTITIEMKE